MLSVNKGDAHVDNRCKKLEKPVVQQIQDARLKFASLLNNIRCVKSTSGCQSVELMRLVFLRPCLTGVTFSNTKFASLLRDTRPVTLRQNAGLIKSTSLKCHQTNATISNVRSVSLISRGTKPASQS